MIPSTIHYKIAKPLPILDVLSITLGNIIKKYWNLAELIIVKFL